MVHEPVNSVCGAGFDERKAGSQLVVGDVHGAQAKAYCLECKFVLYMITRSTKPLRRLDLLPGVCE